tara:strand:+ start:363 stop:815 length:453 start_codon:yes stop_codon:yes gene_type:complete
MRFDLLIESALKNTKLTKVRFKLDPKIPEHSDFAHMHGYEGYILEELDGHVKVLVVNRETDPLQSMLQSLVSVPSTMATPCMQDDSQMGKLKRFITNNIQDRIDDQNSFALTQQLDNASDTQQLEMLLKQIGLEEEEIETLYKTYLNNEQ